ncbi:MAG: exonuclease domain-containing protein [Actinomycetota bacterium]
MSLRDLAKSVTVDVPDAAMPRLVAGVPDSAMPISQVRFAVVDTETTGLSTDNDRVLQIGVVVMRGDGTVEHQFVTYLKRLAWGFGHVGAFHIHGITRRQLRHGMKPAEALEMLNVLIDGCVFTAHNAKFDLGFLRSDSTRLEVPLKLTGPLCTLNLSRRLDPNRTMSHKLRDVAARLGKSTDRPHDALADAQLTGAVLPSLLAAHRITTYGELTAHFG